MSEITFDIESDAEEVEECIICIDEIEERINDLSIVWIFVFE